MQNNFQLTIVLMLFLRSCSESLRMFCFISAANGFTVVAIIRGTNKFSSKVWFHCYSIKGAFELRIRKSVLGIRQHIELKSLMRFFPAYLPKKNCICGQNRVTTANFRLNNRSTQIILLWKLSSVSCSSKSFFHHISLK